MQPPPRTGPPGASGPPPSGPNMFRRSRPQKHAAPPAATMPPATQPMTDPFAFSRTPPPPAVSAGGPTMIPNSNPPQFQTPPPNMYSQPGLGVPPQPQTLEDAAALQSGPPPPSLPGMIPFNPGIAQTSGAFQAPSSTGYDYSRGETVYFNSREHGLSTSAELQPMTVAQTPGQPLHHMPFQPLPPTSSSSQWVPENTSRPPSVQNYFQPTSDPPPIAMHGQMYSSHNQPSHHNLPTQPGHHQPQIAPQQHNLHVTQSYFSQTSAPQDLWFNQPPQDPGYHQMGTGNSQPLTDFPGSQQASSTGPGPGLPPLSDSSQESGALSVLHKDNNVENEESVASERKKAVNGVEGSFQYQSGPHGHGGCGEVSLDYQEVSPMENANVPYMNEDAHLSQGNPQKRHDAQFDHVENLEYVPNQEVLPSETHSSPPNTMPHGVDQFETGPNLETPDSIPRPMRSASVSSNYSNMSHGSATGARRHQGVVGTFIQQESPRLPDDTNLSAAAGGYFEQIDSSPAGDAGIGHKIPEQMWPPTPSPPKPTGNFQASANSSFEPVRSHGVGVRPAEVDRARMVAEGGADYSSGNLEQPPDNMENIYTPAHPQPTGAVGGVPHLTHPVVHSHSRPSSRAFGSNRPCESPATTLWAQNDPTSLGANILLAPAAPTVLAPLREPSVDVIQPPEDGPLDLQPSKRTQTSSQQHSENLENPPKVSDAEPADSQGNLGYASLLVSDSLHQPVLIAPPVSNYTMIPPSINTQSAGQSNFKETSPPERSPAPVQVVSAFQPPVVSSNQNTLLSSGATVVPSIPNQGPLNLTRESVPAAALEIPVSPQSQSAHPPFTRGQSLSGDHHSAVYPNSQASSLMTASASNHNRAPNYELLDFSMHQSQVAGQPSHESSQSSNGFYLQVTKDSQQGVRVEGNAFGHTPASSSTPQVPPASSQATVATQPPPIKSPRQSVSQSAPQELKNAPIAPATGAQPSSGQYATPGQESVPGSAPVAYPPGPRGPPPAVAPQSGSGEPPRPPSSAGSHQGYGQTYGGYYSGYPEGPDGRGPYAPGQYPPADPRAQPYYQDGAYRGRMDPWYGRYDGQGYRDPNYQSREPQPERPNSRASQYSDRPSSRQGFEEFHRANRNPYNEYYGDYSKHYDYGGYNYGQYDPRYRGYYDHSYWQYYDDGYKNYNQYNQQMYPGRKECYDDQWRYYPGYDTSFDDERGRGRDVYGDDFDRRSVHSEQSAHSVHSAHSHHSRRSSFSSRSQQSQVYRSQPDLVSAVYDTTSSTLAANYSYAQYPAQADASQNYNQYLYPSDYNAESSWITAEQPPPRPATPEKFTMPHRCARFGPGGHLIQVLPNLPSAGQPALVDIHNMETMLQDSSDQAELRVFPGPLIREETHKVDVIKFSQNKSLECARDNNLLDRDSARLIWDFIVLLCRQNGTVVGTDIADLLLKEHRSVWLPGKSPNEANLIDFNNEPLARAEEEPGAGPLSLLSDTFMIVPENIGKETERFRELLLFGRKKDALEAAMKGGLWGHALLLASKMDNRTHARVMTRFANSLPMNDPLQTIYQLMSGRMPASATCCGEEKWGDWRPHLAMVLSNLSHNLDLDTRTITTMGDTLASKGLTDAAHFCYLMAQIGLGVYTKKTTKMVLIGSNHSLPFFKFATNEAIQRTEAYEYALSLGSQPCSLPNFQVFKLIYACRLAEAGLCAQAFHYCEVISKTILTQPSFYSPVFISQIIQMSEKLRFFDPQLKERPEQELFVEPSWLYDLRQLDGQIRTGVFTCSADRTTPAQFDCSSDSSDLDRATPPEPYGAPLAGDGQSQGNPLMSSLLPETSPQGVQLMPPAPTSILQDGMAHPQVLPPNEAHQFYPVPPGGPPGQVSVSGFPPQDPGFAPPSFQPDQSEMYPGVHQQPYAFSQYGQMLPPQGPHSPVQMNPPPNQMPPSPGRAPPAEHPLQMYQESHCAQPLSSSPPTSSLPPQMDLYDHMASMVPGRTRTISQSSMHLPSGHSSRRASGSSTHSGGRERSNSAVKQSSPPPPSIPEQPQREEARKVKKDSPKNSRGWRYWIFGKGKNEAHLPDDKNPSIVWDEKKQRWVDLNEPEEESKPLAPPPSGFPKIPQMPPAPPSTGSGPPVNMFSRKAGTKSKYVDVLNPSRSAKPSGLAAAPADMFAPLAPMSMPANLFVPSSAPDDQHPMEGSETGSQEQNSPSAGAASQTFNPTALAPGGDGLTVEGSQSGELSRSSSMSSLSREVSQHLNQGTALPVGITFYNPAQFAQTGAPSGVGLRSGRLGGPRQYPVLK